MKLLSVGLTGVTQDVTARLQRDCGSLLHEGFRIAIDESSKGKYTFVGCSITEGELSFRNYERVKDALKTYVAKIIADFILNWEERKLIRRFIVRRYDYFSKEEQDQIYDNSLQLLSSNPVVLREFGLQERRRRIMTRIMDYFDHHHELVVDGFVQFRLKDYRENLGRIVEKAADDFMMALEYKEYVRVLRYFISTQESQVPEAHVVIHHSQFFSILDAYGKALEHQYSHAVAACNPNDLDYEDLLITALVTLSPYRVIIHNPCNIGALNMVNTVREVFEDRSVMCQGCELCLESIAYTVDSD